MSIPADMDVIKEQKVISRASISSFTSYAMKWCVMSIIFAAPFSKSISEIAIVIGLVALVLYKLSESDIGLIKTDLNFPLLLFIITIIPSFINTDYMLLSAKAFFSKNLKYIALYFVIVEAINNKSKLKDIFSVGLLSGIIIAIDGFVQYYYSGTDGLHNYPCYKMRKAIIWKGDDPGFFRGFPTASFPFPNDFATWICLVIFPIACAAIFDLKNKAVRYIAWINSFGLLFLMFLTKARSAWVGFAISTVFLAIIKRKGWLILLLVLIIAAPFLLRMEMADYIFGASSIYDRFDMWKIGFKIFKDHPFIGNGINTFFRRYMEERTDQWKGKKGSYAHNCYLQMASDVGIIGLLGFLSVIFAHFISVIRHIGCIKDRLFSSVLLGLTMGILAFLIIAFFDTNLFSLNLVTLFWCAIGISQAIILVSARDSA